MAKSRHLASLPSPATKKKRVRPPGSTTRTIPLDDGDKKVLNGLNKEIWKLIRICAIANDMTVADVIAHSARITINPDGSFRDPPNPV